MACVSDSTIEVEDAASRPKAPATEPYFRAVVMALAEGFCAYGVLPGRPPPLGPHPTLGEYLAHLLGGVPRHEGAFPSLEAAVAHALTLPLLDPCRTVTILRPRPAPLPAPRPERVH